MASSLDEVGTEYGLLAEAVRYPEDFSSVTYRLNPKVRWRDGKPVTPQDVIFSLEAFKINSPSYALYYKNVTRVEQTGEREVTFTFSEKNNRELPQIVGQLTILPKHWWEGTDATGRRRDITQTTLELPLGSGPYQMKGFEAGRFAHYERVPDYWAKDLNVRV
jgi:microcin C transport system substrate-binding protein